MRQRAAGLIRPEDVAALGLTLDSRSGRTIK